MDFYTLLSQPCQIGKGLTADNTSFKFKLQNLEGNLFIFAMKFETEDFRPNFDAHSEK